MDIHVEVAGRVVRVFSPDKVLFPDRGWTKRDIVEHYLLCAEGAVRGTWHRPTTLKRWPGGVTENFFFTKRAPGRSRTPTRCSFPRPHGRVPLRPLPRDRRSRAQSAHGEGSRRLAEDVGFARHPCLRAPRPQL